MRIKKAVAFLLVLILAFGVNSTAFAKETPKTYSFSSQTFSSAKVSKNDTTIFERVEPKILACFDRMDEKVDVSAYMMSVTSINNIVNRILDRNPEYFYVDLDNSSFAMDDFGFVEEMYFSYKGTKSQIEKQRLELETTANKILSYIDEDYSTFDKVLFLHDYITSHNEYDIDGVYEDVDKIDFHSFDAYGCLVNNKSVCQGMSDAFYLLCTKLDIGVYMCNSYDMGHAWNVVNVDGKYYHLDITWDDDSSKVGLNFDGENFLDVVGVVSHDYFLKSDDEFLALEHYDWTKDITTECSHFEDAFWQNVNSSIYIIDGYYYFLKDSALVKRDKTTGTETVLYSIPSGKYTCGGKNYVWSANNSVLAYNYEEDYLFMTHSDGVYAYSLKTSEVQKIYSQESGYIGGIAFYDGTLYCDTVQIKDGLLSQGESFSVAYVLEDTDQKEYTTKQLLNLKKYLAKTVVIDDVNYFDINLDGKICAIDVLLIAQLIANS